MHRQRHSNQRLFSARAEDVQQLVNHVDLVQASMRDNYAQRSDVIVAHSTLPPKADAEVYV